MRRVRIRQGEGHADGVLTDDGVELADGSRIDPADADWLAPVEPSKIVATHLSYRSRCDEYLMAAPPQYPSYFLKPPSSVSAHEAEVAPTPRLSVPQLRGRDRGGDRYALGASPALRRSTMSRGTRSPTTSASTTSATSTAARCCG